MNCQFVFVVVVVVSLVGCVNYSGFDVDSKFVCKVFDGVICMFVSGIYVNVKVSNFFGLCKCEDSQSMEKIDQVVGDCVVQCNYNVFENMVVFVGLIEKILLKLMGVLNLGLLLCMFECILCVWLVLFEDQDNDLYDQKYFYVMVNFGFWIIEVNCVNICFCFQQVYLFLCMNLVNKKVDVDVQQQMFQQVVVFVLFVSLVQQFGGFEEQQQ